MSIDNLGDLRHVVDRMGLPPRAKLLVAQLEEKSGPIDKLPKTGEDEVRQILGYVAGPILLAAIVAHALGTIPDDALPQPEPDPEPDEDAREGDDDPVDDEDGGEGDPPPAGDGSDETPPPPPAPPGEPDRTTT